MTSAGIRQLAVVAGAVLVLAGCEPGTSLGAKPAGDAAAAALATDAITAISLDALPGGAPTPAGAPAAADTAGTALAPAIDATAGADPTAASAAPAPAAQQTPARKGLFGFLKPKPAAPDGAAGATTPAPAQRNSVRLVDRDVEAPDVFQVTESGLWDGRPSLGGVWVAYSDVTDPERVIIRNPANGNFVIGALFRRERENPGPRLQVSSDAADALGMLAGAPAKLNVTALRREEVADPANAEALLGTTDPIEASAIAPAADPAASPPAARPAAKPVAKPAVQPAAQPATQSSAPAAGSSFVQIGIFSIETNANGTAETLRNAGLIATVNKEASQGKTFWRVIAGPAATAADRAALIAKVKSLGFADAYFVSR